MSDQHHLGQLVPLVAVQLIRCHCCVHQNFYDGGGGGNGENRDKNDEKYGGKSGENYGGSDGKGGRNSSRMM